MPSSLSSSEVARLTKPGLHRVDRRLYLQVLPPREENEPVGPRSWVFRYMFRRKARQMGLGPYPDISLAKALNRAVAAQRLLLDGVDPIDTKRAERKAAMVVAPTAKTFAACAEEYIAGKAAGWSNEKHAYQWSQSIQTYANPTIGALPVDGVTAEHVAKLLREIWASKSETAGRLRGRIEAILEYARVSGYRSGPNPAKWKGELEHRLPALADVQKIEHHEALPWGKAPAFHASLVARDGVSSQALRFILLTAARSGEVRGMRWKEIDRKSKVWVVPAERMKGREEHRVPLTEAALAALPATGEVDALVFPGAKEGEPLSDAALIKVARKLVPDITVHGLRASFSTWAAEATDYPREVVEAALAHKIANPVEAAYKRTSFFDKRRELMETWGNHVIGNARLADAA